jgi:hypothetical protein
MFWRMSFRHMRPLRVVSQKIVVLGPVEPGTRNDSCGVGQQQYTRPDLAHDCLCGLGLGLRS